MVQEKYSAVRSDIVKGAITLVVSFVLFQFRAVFFLFLIPLFLYGMRRSWEKTALVLLVLWTALFVQTMVLTAGIDVPGIDRKLLVLVDLSYPSFLLAGILGFFLLKGRALKRFLIVSVAAGCVSVPVILAVAANQSFTGLLREQIIAITELLRQPLSDSGSFESSLLMAQLDPQTMVETTKDLFFRFSLAAYCGILVFGYAVARGIRARFLGEAPVDVAAFRVPDRCIWGLLVVLPIVALDLFVDIGFWAYPFWNAATVLLLIYAFQGFGIIRYRMLRSPRLRRARFFLTVLFLMLLFLPGANIVALLAIPLLGVSELWVRYREV